MLTFDFASFCLDTSILSGGLQDHPSQSSTFHEFSECCEKCCFTKMPQKFLGVAGDHPRPIRDHCGSVFDPFRLNVDHKNIIYSSCVPHIFPIYVQGSAGYDLLGA